MALVNKYGESISYECGGMIERLRKDIQSHGGSHLVWTRMEIRKGVAVCTEYSLNEQEGCDKPMTMTALMTILEQQNSVI